MASNQIKQQTRRARVTQLRRDLERQLEDDVAGRSTLLKYSDPHIFDDAVVITPPTNLKECAQLLLDRVKTLLVRV